MDIIRVSYLQLLKQESIIFLNNVIMIFLIDIMFGRVVVFLLSVLKYSGDEIYKAQCNDCYWHGLL